MRALIRRPITWAALALIAVIAGSALPLFQPWKLWIDQTVNEAPPPTAVAGTIGSDPTDVPSASPPVVAAEPTVLARGALVSHEHHTTGSVLILSATDGSRYLRFEDLDTSNGPQLEVWLTDATVISGTGGWYSFDDGRHVSLGSLKGNKGNQNYPLPADLDLGQFRSVSIWCARFQVSFGAAELTA